MAGAPERLHLHTTRPAAAGIVLVAALTGGAALLGGRISDAASWIAGVAAALVGGGVFAFWRWREGLVLTRIGLERRRLLRTRRVPWADIVALVATCRSSDPHDGYDLRLVTWPHAERARLGGTTLPERCVVALRTFVAQHGVDVGVEITRPRDDERRTWHRELRGASPEESLRAVRRAAVGPWLVRVVVGNATFQAVVEDAHTSAVRERGPVRSTLAAAIDDGVAMIADLRVG